MAKLEQKARKGLYGGFKPGSTGGPGTGKLKNTTKRVTANLKRAVGDVASNVKDKIETRKTTSTTPIKKEMVHSQILNEYDSPASRLQEQFSGLNQDAMQALVAGGSRPLHQGTSSQIDPMTGMPIVPGGQPPINPAFSGAIQNSGIPNYNPGMNMGALAQARIEMSRDEKKAQIMSRDLPQEVKVNMIEGIKQDKSVFENLKEFGGKVMDGLEKADSTVMNMMDKAALKVGILNEDEYANRVKMGPRPAFGIRQEANNAKKDGTLVVRMGEAAAKAVPILKNMKIVENIIVPDTTYKIGNKGPRKSMVVKRNK